MEQFLELSNLLLLQIAVGLGNFFVVLFIAGLGFLAGRWVERRYMRRFNENQIKNFMKWAGEQRSGAPKTVSLRDILHDT